MYIFNVYLECLCIFKAHVTLLENFRFTMAPSFLELFNQTKVGIMNIFLPFAFD